MAKGKTSVFFCQNCGYESAKWMGQCPGCKEWNTFVEETIDKKSISSAGKRRTSEATPIPLSKIQSSDEERTTTGMPELDRVLGGGIVKGSLVLVGGDPGIGKSTLLLQVCHNLCNGAGEGTKSSSEEGRHVLYISGEESLQQIKLRADRLGEFSDALELLCETNLEVIREVIERGKPQVVIVDSIQTMYSDEVGSAPGSVSQVREATGVFMQIAKGMGISIFIVGHVTKEGVVAGPRVLEHIVDTVLYFEGDRHESYRILRGVKNRFGSTNEIGVFEMRSEGLVEVENPSEYMLSGKPKDASGSVVACSMEGTRPVLLEIQALVCHSFFNNPRRTATGTDYNRVNLLMAVLEKRLGMQLSDCDAYVNIAGGIRMTEPAIDLGIVLAIISSKLDLTIDERTICFGEIGLSGEVRGVSMAEQRVMEAKKLGFETCILPQVCKDSLLSTGAAAHSRLNGIALVGVSNVKEALDAIRSR
ncbi:MAG: DNA repair protein RadA [Lachnospiraceae bacterium]|nr:DNA repair protein RadA [Lachnospiraceae bacterium]